jgi:hypothetical protein
MPNRFRATWFYSDGDYGWSETLWESPPSTSYLAVAKKADVLGILRLGLLGNTTTWLGTRVSDDLVRRDSLYVEKNLTSADQGGKLAVNIYSERPYSVITLRMEATALARRIAYLSGAPYTIVTNPFLIPDINGTWGKSFMKWVNEIVKPNALPAPQWGFFGFDTTAANPALPITFISTLAGTVNCPGHTFVPTDTVFLDQTNPRRPFVGKYTVAGVVGNIVTLQRFVSKKYPAPQLPPPSGWGITPWNSGGQLRKYVDAVLPITAVLIRAATHRNRGRPFGSPHGRRR